MTSDEVVIRMKAEMTQLEVELQAEHERVMAWRVLCTDVWMILIAPQGTDTGPQIEAWLGAHQRQLQRDSDAGCLHS